MSLNGGVQCHYCFQMFNKINPAVFLAKCCKKRCHKYYCMLCINNKFDQMFEEYFYRRDTWICYSCQHLCDCSICQGIDASNKKNRKNKAIATKKRNLSKDSKSVSINQQISRNASLDNQISDKFMNERSLTGEDEIMTHKIHDWQKKHKLEIVVKKVQKLSTFLKNNEPVNMVTNLQKNNSNYNQMPCFLKRIMDRKKILLESNINQIKNKNIVNNRYQQQFSQKKQNNQKSNIKQEYIYKNIKKQQLNQKQKINNLKKILKNTLTKYEDVDEQEIQILSQ